MSQLPPLSDSLQKLVEAWTARPGASVAPRHNGGVTLFSGIEEIGHLHPDGTLHLAFPRPMRDALVKAGAVDAHPTMPDSSWVVYRIHGNAGIDGALDLLARAETALHESTDPLRESEATGPSGAADRQVDQGVEETFPASDPPATSSST